MSDKRSELERIGKTDIQAVEIENTKTELKDDIAEFRKEIHQFQSEVISSLNTIIIMLLLNLILLSVATAMIILALLELHNTELPNECVVDMTNQEEQARVVELFIADVYLW